MEKMIDNLSRRSFIKNTTGLAGTGLVLGIVANAIPHSFAAVATGNTANTFEPNVFLSIDTSGQVTLVCARTEMGQGVRTSLPAIIADELEAAWERITVIQGIGDASYGDQNTDGSTSIRVQYPIMRQAGAAAREMLEAAAASIWNVPVAQCKANNHAVHHRKTGRSLGYGDLAQAAADLAVPNRPTLKSPEDFRYIGKSLSNIDNADFISGRAKYGIDAQIEGMLYASIERSPVLGGSIESYDAAEALAMPGVKKVIILAAATTPPLFNSVGGLAVIADNTWTAVAARKKLRIQWNEGPNRSYHSTAYRHAMATKAQQPGKVFRKTGDVKAALAKADKTISADYYQPHLSHAPMEPPCCLASVTKERCEVWAPTQDPQTARRTLANVLQLDPEQVTVNVTLLGGAFGRKSKPDFIVEAALLSKQTGTPIKVTWSREDDIRHDYYHSACAQHLTAGFDNNNNPVAWLHRAVFPSINTTFAPGEQYASAWEMGGASQVPYDIANIRCENGSADAHVRIGWLRSVHNINQAFAVNSFMAEMAAAVGKNQKDYLLALIGKPRIVSVEDMDNKEHPFDTGRLRTVIETVARESGWGKKQQGRRALGIAAHYSFLSYIAQVADVSVDTAGNVTVHTVHCAIDCGTVVNPDRVTAQMEGAIIYGLSNALYGVISADKGRIEQSNFHDYQVLRLHETPEIHVHIINSNALPSGVGEPGTPPISPALTNAIYNATGVRLRELPINNKQLRV